MITGMILGLAGTLFSGLIFAVDTVPIPGPGGVVNPIESGAGAIATHAQGLGYWVPFDTIGPALAVLALCVVASWGIRLTRMVLSVLTGGGGAGG